jgi:DNA-binding transcriptional LysR family regulator
VFELRRLEILHHLAHYGTVTAAAEALHLTGPAVSQQLAALEREAGTTLVEKRGRTLALTPAGRLLASHAEIILDDVAAAEAALAMQTGRGTGTVRLAAFPSAARRLVPGAWARLREQTGGAVSIRLVEQEPDRSVDALLRHSVDIAIAHSYTLLPRDIPARCEVHNLVGDPVLLAVHPGVAAEHRLAPGRRARLDTFGHHPWLVPAPDVSCHELVQRACGAAGFVPNVVAEAADFSVLTSLVAARLGVALVPTMALPDTLPPISLHPLVQPVIRRVFALTRLGHAQRPDIRRTLDQLIHVAATMDHARAEMAGSVG